MRGRFERVEDRRQETGDRIRGSVEQGGGPAPVLNVSCLLSSISFAGAGYRPFPPATAGSGFLGWVSGTRNMVWQCWHLTRRPRTSSGTDRNFRQRRFG